MTFCGKKSNLHKVWDTLLIDERIKNISHDNITEYFNYLLNLLHTTYANNITNWAKCPSEDEAEYLACSTAWINENMDLNCAYVYRDENNNPMNGSDVYHLCDIYFNRSIVFLEQRLLQAGVRLGAVINKIVQLQKHHHKKDDQTSDGVLFFIIIILLESILLLFVITYNTVRRRPRRQPLANVHPACHVYDTNKK